MSPVTVSSLTWLKGTNVSLAWVSIMIAHQGPLEPVTSLIPVHTAQAQKRERELPRHAFSMVHAESYVHTMGLGDGGHDAKCCGVEAGCKGWGFLLTAPFLL